jgi:hypothetical protein
MVEAYVRDYDCSQRLIWWQKFELGGRNRLEAMVEAGGRGRGWWQMSRLEAGVEAGGRS